MKLRIRAFVAVGMCLAATLPRALGKAPFSSRILSGAMQHLIASIPEDGQTESKAFVPAAVGEGNLNSSVTSEVLGDRGALDQLSGKRDEDSSLDRDDVMRKSESIEVESASDASVEDVSTPIAAADDGGVAYTREEDENTNLEGTANMQASSLEVDYGEKEYEEEMIPSAEESKKVDEEVQNKNVVAEAGEATAVALPDTYESTIATLVDKYKDRMVHCTIPQFPNCDIFLCGTLHVAKTSAEMVTDVINELKPDFVVLELCETRADSLCVRELANVTLADVMKATIKDKSMKTFGEGMLAWLQLKAAKTMGNTLGGELSQAAQSAYQNNAILVLGDRLYGVTIQRVFDKLNGIEKAKMLGILMWEVMTMSFWKLRDYIKKTESDVLFVQQEIARFRKWLPSFASVIIDERDEYLSQTLCEIARVGFRNSPPQSAYNANGARGKVVAVVGAGHLEGMQKWLSRGGTDGLRIVEISKSSKHEASTWPGQGMLQVVDTERMMREQERERARNMFLNAPPSTSSPPLPPPPSSSSSSSSFDQTAIPSLSEPYDAINTESAVEPPR